MTVFLDIPDVIQTRMSVLEQRDRIDRTDGTERLNRLRQIPRETGHFIALLAASAPEGTWIEIGTSAGYSTLWLSLAARERATTLTTYELLSSKYALATETFVMTEVNDVVTSVHGDFLDHASELEGISFCFLDAEKEAYLRCYHAVVSRLVPGGLLVADNAISHQVDLQSMLDAALSDPRVDAMIVPLGKGELVCRRRAYIRDVPEVTRNPDSL